MKKLLIAIVIAGLFLTSCQKADKQELLDETIAASAPASTLASGWITLNFTSGASTAKGVAIAEATVATEAVTDEVLADGMVLVFSKNDQAVTMLPYQGADIDWNYTISKGQVAVTAVSSNTVSAALVQYVVLSSAKISELEKSGYSRNDLVNLPYQKAQSLLGVQ